MYFEEKIQEIQELKEIKEVAVHFTLNEKSERDDIYKLWVKDVEENVVEVLIRDNFGRQNSLLYVLCSLILNKCLDKPILSFDLKKEILEASSKYSYQGKVVLNNTPCRGWSKEMIF